MLELGSVPRPVATVRIDRFITEDGKGPYPDMEGGGLRLSDAWLVFNVTAPFIELPTDQIDLFWR